MVEPIIHVHLKGAEFLGYIAHLRAAFLAGYLKFKAHPESMEIAKMLIVMCRSKAKPEILHF